MSWDFSTERERPRSAARIRSVPRPLLDRRDLLPGEEDLRRVFDQLYDTAGDESPDVTCTLPLDVLETAAAIEVVMDAPGLALADLSIVVVRHTLVISGRKSPGACTHAGVAFHLAERTFGRFVRGVRLTGAFDAGRADARLRDGVLRVTLPRIEERRGGRLRIAVRGA